MGSKNIVPVAAEHSIRLATASLSVGKDGYIITLRTFRNKRFKIIEYFALSTFHSKNSFQLLFTFARRHLDLDGFLCEGRSTLSMQLIDYL